MPMMIELSGSRGGVGFQRVRGRRHKVELLTEAFKHGQRRFAEALVVRKGNVGIGHGTLPTKLIQCPACLMCPIFMKKTAASLYAFTASLLGTEPIASGQSMQM